MICRCKTAISRQLSAYGFSLIELVIVLAILGIATALVSPAIPRSLDGWRLRTSARQLVALMRYAQSQALATKEPVAVVLDRGAGRGGIAAGEDPIRWRVTLPDGVRFLWSGDETEARFTFEPWGWATGGSVELVNRQSQAFRIVVDTATGRVRLETVEAGGASRT
jgi:general secretion pathway protein H